jgi:hypothetical protein
MARTTSAAVQAILLDDYGAREDGTEPSLTGFIETANVITTRVATCAAAKDKTLTSTELELIERWLAAHCYVQSDQALSSKNTGGSGGSFQGQTGMHLENSKYGQMALSIDYSGCLAAISKRQTAGGFWGGKTRTEALDYEERN